jgi:ribulose-5-phosphate 4-epimerase/fuculose-1-phosphate aldolase
VLICPESSSARNFGFDVTPARLITGLVTERGVAAANEGAISALFPDASGTGMTADVSGIEAEEGVVKFTADHFTAPLGDELITTAETLDAARLPLHQADLVSEHDGIGFGNLSCRVSREQGCFMVTGTSTGRLGHLALSDFAVVEASKPWENSVMSRGETRPSSESMTHAAIYAARPDVGAVIHIHAPVLFEKLLRSDCPRTSEDIAYGTPAMALAVAGLVRTMPGCGVFVTPGHRDGVSAFGRDAAEVAAHLLSLNNDL